MQRTLETLSLLALLGVVALRPLVSESYDSSQNPLTASLSAAGDPMPVRTLVFNLVILVSCVGWLISRALGKTGRYRPTGLEWGWGIVGVAATISCFVAGQKRLGINASIDWLCYPILAITLVQVMRCAWQRRLLLAVVLATACVQAGQCLEQSLVGYEETWEHYQSIKEEFWAQQGVPLDSPKVDSFERRIQSGEATGGLTHSNVTGSYLSLCMMAAIGLAIGAWPSRGDDRIKSASLGGLALAALLLAALLSTNSTGATLASAVGAGAWALIYWRRKWINTHRTKAVWIGWGMAFAGILATTGHGLYHDSLPGWSLTFRWQWWKASADLIKDQGMLGVGRENFRREYLAYKSIESPEEVANPHNLFVQFAAELGALGLAGLLLMMVAVSFKLAKPVVEDRSSTAGRDPPIQNRIGLYGLVIGAVVIFGRLPLLGSDDPNFVYYTAMTSGIVWVIGFLLVSRTWNQEVERTRVDRWPLATGVGVGLFVFVLHDMINFAFFVPSAATTFFALVAYSISERSEGIDGTESLSKLVRWGPVSGMVAGIAMVLAVGLVPVARSNASLGKAREAAQAVLPVDPSNQLAFQYWKKAAQEDQLDPAPLAESAAWLMQLSRRPDWASVALTLADRSLKEAIRRDPASLKLRRLQVQFFLRKAQIDPTPDHYDEAIQAANAARELYPQDPQSFVILGDCQLTAGRSLSGDLAKKHLQDASTSLRNALELDEKRLWWEELQRFSETERASIKQRIEEADQLRARSQENGE